MAQAQRICVVGLAAGLIAVLLQGCGLPKKPKACSKEGFNCMDTGCCVDDSMTCFARDESWASCKTSCTPDFGTSCAKVQQGGGLPPTTAPPSTSTVTATTTTVHVTPIPEDSVEWQEGTWTTGYWDCCKPSCSWSGKGKVNHPAFSCDAKTGKKLHDSNVKSVCDGGTAVTCADNKPFVIHSNLSMGFAAAAVSGHHGLTGDENCGQCYELLFTDEQHIDKGTGDKWGGSHPDLAGKRMIIQITNIGYDVTGNHSFDILVPGAGQGIFEKGCKGQYSDYEVDDFDCGKRHGGCSEKDGCSKLPEEMQEGCEWHFDWFHWLKSGGRSNNPFIKFRRVRCPSEITDISGTTPEDDEKYPNVIEATSFYFI